ncbi:chemotaxis protein CheW [Schlesneria paludicola]|uniref:chemotaxis protein CheW n=1 Tax=Schlesneria paludicola TaxID=360056 RepID=UPI00029B366C|nr:chemotaxis protein CheW [Schlesneria paludicola]
MESLRLFCTFRLNGQLFGVDTLDVKEVTNEPTWTPVAHAPEEVLGLVNIRGHIFLALDLRQLLGMPSQPVTAQTRLVLFKPHVGCAFGVVVDEISEIQSVNADRLEGFASIHRDDLKLELTRIDLVSAICKQFDELIVILNPRRFLTVVEQNFARSDRRDSLHPVSGPHLSQVSP